jgi:hypothetical protein
MSFRSYGRRSNSSVATNPELNHNERDGRDPFSSSEGPQNNSSASTALDRAGNSQARMSAMPPTSILRLIQLHDPVKALRAVTQIVSEFKR